MKALVRLSPEITTKAPKTRARFVRTLVENLRAALAAEGLQADIRRDHSRMYLDFEAPEVLGVARRVFGILSVSPCREEPLTDLDALVAKGVELMRRRAEGRAFAVRARVRDDRAGFNGQKVNEVLGHALKDFGKVRLDDPEVTVHLEVRDGRIRFFTDVLAGEGGMPVGVGGRALVLLSAGFDSAVAAFLMLRRGVHVDFVSCRLGGDTHERAVLAVANRLVAMWMPGLRSRLLLVPFEETVERLRREVTERYRQLVLKRLMYRTAEAAARITKADAIVTGESIGQVSSQTLRNLRALTVPADLPVMRPLLGHSKVEILAIARRAGTYHLSSGVPEYCDLGSKPATGAHRKDVVDEESRLEFDEAEALKAGRVIALPSEGYAEAGAEVATDEVPTGAVLLDLRAPPARSRGEIAGARVVDPIEIIGQPQLLDGDEAYVVICDSGARSDWFARRLRELGFRAWSLRDPSRLVGSAGEA